MRRIRRGCALLLVCGLLGTATFPRVALAQQGTADTYLRELARIRGVPVPAQPRIVIRSDAETRRLLAANLERGRPADWWEAQEKALRKFALIPPGFRVKDAALDLLSEMILAYFDFDRQELVLRRQPSAPEDETTFVHELVHLLQHSLFDAKAFLTLGPGRGDEALARRAVLEGEAQALTLDLVLARRGEDITKLPDLAMLSRMSAPPLPPRAAALPRVLREELLFPYVYGVEFVRQFRLRHPWADFSRLYRDPPRSTAQILHPHRYLLFRQDPRPVRLPDLSPALGDGWRLIREDDLGALGLIIVLQAYLDELRARRLSEEWDGDRYQLYEGPNGRLALVVFTTWRFSWKAREFASGYEELLQKKYPTLSAVSGPATLPHRFKAGEEAVSVETRDREVLILEGVSPDREAALREAIWRARP